MRMIGRFLVLATCSVVLVNCGGGKSKHGPSPEAPAAPVVSVSADVKQLIFSWDAVATASFYRLLENPDGHSGFTQVGSNIPGAETSVVMDIAVHLHDWVNAQYLVEACNANGCTPSTVVPVDQVMLETIGTVASPNAGETDAFGEWFTLSADGSTLAVSAWYDSSSSAGIDGDESDNSMRISGAVHVYRRSGNQWTKEAFIKASNPDADDIFGREIALSRDGGTMAIGATGEDSAATGVDGDQDDDSVASAGAIYVFRRRDGAWEQESYIKAPHPSEFDYLGAGLALSDDGNTLAASLARDDSGASGINGDPEDDSVTDSGAALIYRFEDAAWKQEAYIKAALPDERDDFGIPVSLSGDGDTLALGVYGEDSAAVGVNGDSSDNSAPDAGAVYVYQFANGAWQQQAYLKASNMEAGDRFGRGLVLSRDGNTLAIGSPLEDSGSSGIDGEQQDNSAPQSGAVYVFTRTDGSWTQDAYLKASNPDPGDGFGLGLALNDEANLLAVSASGEDSAAVGINGDQSDNSAAGNFGAVYLFSFSDSTWRQVSYVKSPNPPAMVPSGLGYYVMLSGDGTTMVVSTTYGHEAVFWY